MVIFSHYAKVDALFERDVKIGVDAVTFHQILNAWDEYSAICLLLIQYGFICLGVISLPKHVYDQFIYGWLSVLLSWKAICFVLPWASVLDFFSCSSGSREWQSPSTPPLFLCFNGFWMLVLRLLFQWTYNVEICHAWTDGLKKAFCKDLYCACLLLHQSSAEPGYLWPWRCTVSTSVLCEVLISWFSKERTVFRLFWTT